MYSLFTVSVDSSEPGDDSSVSVPMLLESVVSASLGPDDEVGLEVVSEASNRAF